MVACSPTTESTETDSMQEVESTVEGTTTEYQVTHTGTISVEGFGDMNFELYGEIAPITVENFVTLAKEGFYDGLTFHRVVENFVIQGGDPLGNGTGGSDNTITGEFSSNNIANPILHQRGVLSMARSMDVNSASSQFFIMHADVVSLDGSYAAFGALTSGLDVLDSIVIVEKETGLDGALSQPIEPVTITSITID